MWVWIRNKNTYTAKYCPSALMNTTVRCLWVAISSRKAFHLTKHFVWTKLIPMTSRKASSDGKFSHVSGGIYIQFVFESWSVGGKTLYVSCPRRTWMRITHFYTLSLYDTNLYSTILKIYENLSLSLSLSLLFTLFSLFSSLKISTLSLSLFVNMIWFSLSMTLEQYMYLPKMKISLSL